IRFHAYPQECLMPAKHNWHELLAFLFRQWLLSNPVRKKFPRIPPAIVLLIAIDISNDLEDKKAVEWKPLSLHRFEHLATKPQNAYLQTQSGAGQKYPRI